MNHATFDTVIRRAAGTVSRRGSLRLLDGASLAGAFAVPEVANAGKAGGKAQKRCKRQRGQRRASLVAFCDPKGEPSACEEAGHPYCENFARCNAGAGIECLFKKVLA